MAFFRSLKFLHFFRKMPTILTFECCSVYEINFLHILAESSSWKISRHETKWQNVGSSQNIVYYFLSNWADLFFKFCLAGWFELVDSIFKKSDSIYLMSVDMFRTIEYSIHDMRNSQPCMIFHEQPCAPGLACTKIGWSYSVIINRSWFRADHNLDIHGPDYGQSKSINGP